APACRPARARARPPGRTPMTSMTPLTDDRLRDALRREPAAGLATLVADEIAREVSVRPQRRPHALRWPWTGPEPAVVHGPWGRRVLTVALAALLVAGLLISIAAMGAFLRRPSELRNGSIAIGPPEGGVTVLDAGGHPVGRWSQQPADFLTWSPDG